MIKPGVDDCLLGYCHNGSVASCFMDSVLAAFAEDARRPVRRLTEYHGAQGPYIHDNRSRIARYFLEQTNKQWLWMLDNDMDFPVDSLYRLLEAAETNDMKIVGGAYWNQYPSTESYLSWLLITQDGVRAIRQLPLSEDPIEVSAVGMGCTLIHRDALQDVADMYPNDPWDTFAADMLVRFHDGGMLVGRTPEDFDAEMLKTRSISDIQRMGEDVTFPVDPATKVLDAHWNWRLIEKYNIGDSVLAFDEMSSPHSSRRYQTAIVEGIVERRLPRVRLITDEDEIITTAEHPWLSKTGSEKWWSSYPWRWLPAGQLKVGMPLAAVVPQVQNPDLKSEDYAQGYVQGLMHSDGTGAGKTGQASQAVVRMKDPEPLERLATMLANCGIESIRGPLHWDGNPRHAPTHRLSVNDWLSISWLAPLVTFTGLPSKDFAAGYLAGMYDGDGSHHGGKLQIHSVRDSYKDRIEKAARLVGVSFDGRDSRSVWMHSQDKIFRFWQSTLPSLSRRIFPLGQLGNDGVSRTGQEVKHRPSILRSIEKLPQGDVLCLQTSSNTFIAGSGLASHNCLRARKAGFLTYGLPSLVAEHYKPHLMAHGKQGAVEGSQIGL